MSTFEIADSFDATDRLRVNLNAPLPLSHHAAIKRALELREGPSLSYPTIAYLMGSYHGFNRSASWWQVQLRAAGAPARPRGMSWCGPERVQL